MDLGMAPLFDLPAAPAAGVVDVPLEAVQLSRGDEHLQSIQGHRAAIVDHQLGEVRDIAEWAMEHTVALPEDASTLTERGLDTGLPLAGEGAPLISDFAVLELGAILGRGVDSTRNYVGQVVELSHRLPMIWAGVLDGHLATWRALRIADCTRTLSADAVAYVDQHLSRFAATCSWAQVERLIDEAMTRFDPDLAEERQTAGTILVRQVLDIAGHEPVGAYEIAERQARQVLLRDQTCVFPHCTRPAEACDLDHVIPHAKGGVTCPCNLAPCCRGHHRLKTHRHWAYRVLAPGVYHWRARTGDQWLVTPGGTYTLDTQPCPGTTPAGSADPPPG